MKLLLLLTFFLPLSASALELKPFVCPENFTEYKGVVCCLDELTPQQCREMVDQRLSAATHERIHSFLMAYDQGQFQIGKVPNCHWNARYAEVGSQTPLDLVEEADLRPYLQDNFTNIANNDFQPGDILSFILDGEFRDDIMVGPVPRRIWTPYQLEQHTAIYLGDGFVFQKENAGTKYFSIARLDRTLSAYEKAATQYPHIRGNLFIEAWRKARQSRREP